jgi:hypothetical protein
VKLPHAALPEATSFANLHGFEEQIKVAKIEGQFVSVLCATEEQANAMAEHCGQLYGRLCVSRFVLEEPEPETSQYRRTDLGNSLKKKVSVKEARKMMAAVSILEKSNRPNTWNPTQQNLQAARDAEANAFKHDLDDAGSDPTTGRQAELR